MTLFLDTPKNDSGLSMSDRSPMTIENRSEEKEEDSWGTNPNNSSNNNKPSLPQFDITKISPNVSSNQIICGNGPFHPNGRPGYEALNM